MRMKLCLCWLACVGTLVLTGCVSTVDGRHQAGVPFTKDRVEGRYERTPQDLWTASKDVLKYLGTITSEDSLRSTIEANVDTRKVWVLVEPVDAKLSHVIVQARTKGGGGDLELAAHIDKLIAVRLASGNLTPATLRRVK